MARSRKNVRQRLQEAALALFEAKGFPAVTSTDIADAAGLTQRTFFRHFADKREVLFDGEAALAQTLADAVRGAPAGLHPWTTLRSAFLAATPLLVRNRPFSAPRRRIIALEPALQEREAAKVQGLVSLLAGSLQQRGVPASTATLAAQLGMALFAQAFSAWLDDEAIGFETALLRAFDEASRLITGDDEG